MRYGKQTIMLTALAAAALLATHATAATLYRWTDENGTVHFADTPPQHARQLKAETLPDAPPTPAPPAEAGPAGDATPADPEAAEGPARVVVSDRHADPVGPAMLSVRGKVKNDGGAEAHDVSVAIVVTEPTQGDECLRDRMDVTPPDLASGAEGTFEAQFNSPCFYGPTEIDLRAQWR